MGLGSGKGDPELLSQLDIQRAEDCLIELVRMVASFEKRKLISSKELTHPGFYSKKGLPSA